MQHPLKFLLLVVFACFLMGNKQAIHEYKIKGYAQGTSYAVSYYAQDSLVTKMQVDSILNVIDSSMSLYKSYSTINKFNHSENGVQLDEHFAKVINRSFEIYHDSGGLFDITIGPLVQYWGFGPDPLKREINSGTIAALLKNVGMDQLKLEKNRLTKPKAGIQIDVNGIAQGYTVDVLAEHLIKKGISIFIIELGGELRVSGPKPDGKLMKIGIEGPSENKFEEPTIQHIISFKTGAITTSGNYRNYLLQGSQKISHLINPKTGYPLENDMVSVTIFASDAITADGYDNVLMAMSVKEAMAFVAARKNLEAYLIYKKRDGKLADTASVGFQKMMLN